MMQQQEIPGELASAAGKAELALTSNIRSTNGF
jgi:hypothetical protein